MQLGITAHLCAIGELVGTVLDGSGQSRQGRANVALRRVAECGGGCLGFKLAPSGAEAKIQQIEKMLTAGHSPAAN